MHVVATAGHVDHGKSTLVDALTGMRSDRLEEEQRRGLSIELGYVWTTLPGAGEVAFVDVPGHEKFVTTMLAGVGPVPAVLLVVAADDPWMPQAAEHLAGLDALGVRHAVVAVTRCDLADPAPAMARVADEVSRTSLRCAAVVPVSGRTGEGLDDLRDALADMVSALPVPDPAADVRLWVDRRFTVKGAGTVVTGTLPAGRVARGDQLALDGVPVRVRGVQALGRPVEEATGVARVALNLVGDDLATVERGSVLTTPGAWHASDLLDVRLRGDAAGVPALPHLHVGATSVVARTRPLSDDVVRLRLERPLPLRIGDRALLRDPGSRRVWGVIVLDPAPPPLRRRGAAARRAQLLVTSSGTPDLRGEVERRGIVRSDLLRRLGVPLEPVPDGVVAADGWLMGAARRARVAAAVAEAVARHDRERPLDPGVGLAALAERLRLPSPALVAAAVPPPLRVEAGRVLAPGRAGLPSELERALTALEQDLVGTPFAAPTADRLAQLGLDTRRLGAAAKAGRVLRVSPEVVLLPGADRLAAERLRDLPQPFTTSEARVRLDTSRRVALPLLDLLDRSGLTRRLPDDRREVL